MSNQRDTGKKLPGNAREARSAINRLIQLAEEALESDPEQAHRLSEQAASACRSYPFDKKPYLRGLARSYNSTAAAFVNQGEFGQGLKYHSESLSIYKQLNNPQKIASQLNNVGIVYAYCGDYAEALKYLRSAETLLDDHFPLSFRAQVLNNVGFTYVALGDFANAIPILLASLETVQKRTNRRKNPIAEANIYDSLCQAYLAQNNLDAALQAGMKSTALCHQVGDLKKEAEYMLILGDVYERMENRAQSYHCYQQTLTLARSHGFRREEAEAYRRLGIHQTHQGNFEQAAQLLGDALAIAMEIKIQREIYECHYALSLLYKATGDFKNALNHYENFHQIKEAVFNDQSDQRIKNLEMLHRVEQARRETEIHQQKNIELQKEIIERKKAQKLTESLARTDSLTGIYNRRHFYNLAEKCISEAIQTQAPLGAIILDVDHFKAVNDQYGHQEGDRTLVAIARRIRAMLRTGDIVARYGGEEFAVLLPQAGPDLALAVAERLRAAVESLEISPSYPELKVTISLGVASLQANVPPAELNLEKLLNHADQAMYTAKRQGRNRVAAYSA